MPRVALSVCFVPTLAAACMTGPTNVSERCGTDEQVHFAGYTLAASQAVSIQASTTATGPWVEIATATTSTSSIDLAGISLYAWSADAMVPSWTPIVGGQEAFVRSRLASGGFTLVTFDNAATSGTVGGVQCVITEVIAGVPVATAVSSCQSPDSPVVRLTAPTVSDCPCPPGIVHVGDVTITDPADLVTYECVETIDGNLDVPLGVFVDVELPQLAEVTGSVTLDLNWAWTGVGDHQRNVDLPALSTIGGDVGVDWDNIAVPGPTINIGLDATTTVGGDITIDVHSVNYNLQGLDNLVTHAGDLSIVGSTGDVSGSAFAPNLVDIGGDLLFEPGYTVSWMFQALQTVGGNVTLDGGFWDPGNSGFGVMQTIGGDLTLTNTQNAPIGDLFDALTSVGGALILRETDVQQLSHVMPLAVSVGSLALELNDDLDTLDGSITVDVAGAITITDNPALDTCDAETFVADQVAAGWAGAETISGNGGASCP